MYRRRVAGGGGAGLIGASVGAVAAGVGGAGGGGVDAVWPSESGATLPAGAAIAEQEGVAATSPSSGVAVVDAGYCGPALPAGAAIAPQPSAVAATTAGRAGAAHPARPAASDQPGVATVAAGLARVAGRTGTAVAEQNPAGPAGCSRRGRVGAVPDQWAPEQCLGRRVDQVQHVLLQRLQRRGVGGLGACVHASGASQGLHEPLMKRRRVCAEHLIGLGVFGKQRCHRRRDLISPGRQQPGGRGCCRGIGRAEHRADVLQIRRRRRQHIRRRHHKRHSCLPPSHQSPARLRMTVGGPYMSV
ncbi:hypothetical protein MSIMFI_05450 [Mycobacterium simulans]|nr:hypothetical protein MSIMFI_05450 [Mycobacterium simulans]